MFYQETALRSLVYNIDMKRIKKIVQIIGFAAAFVLCGLGFRYLLVDDTRSYTRLMMHEFYDQKNIDILFAGSSHCYGSLDPSVTDTYFEGNTFNAGSSLQAQDASFALIREAVERCQVKHVFLEMYYLMMDNDDYREREQFTGTYIVSDYMRPSLNKVRFLLEASSPKYYINSFLPARRNWEKLLHPAEIRELLSNKQTAEYREYQPFDGYRAKGFVANQGTIPDGLLLDTAGFDSIHPESASEDWLNTIRDIIAYCEKKGVELTLFSAPMTMFQTVGVGNYDDYVALLREMVKGTKAEYVDFNLCREEYFDQAPDLFSDAGHMNDAGAETFSHLFGAYFSGQIPAEALFYDTMADKIAAHGPDIFGLSYLDSGDGMRKLKIVSSFPEETQYSVEITDPDGTTRLLNEDSADLYFEIPQEEHGTLRIIADETVTEIGV